MALVTELLADYCRILTTTALGDEMRNIAFIAAAALVASFSIQATEAASKKPFRDAVKYCKAIGTGEPYGDKRYGGPDVPGWVATAIGVDKSEEYLDRLVHWRCYRGKILACREGGSHPLCNTMDDTTTPLKEFYTYCKENPNEKWIPGYMVGNAYSHGWSCIKGKPKATRRFYKLDSEGYPIDPDTWVDITPN